MLWRPIPKALLMTLLACGLFVDLKECGDRARSSKCGHVGAKDADQSVQGPVGHASLSRRLCAHSLRG